MRVNRHVMSEGDRFRHQIKCCKLAMQSVALTRLPQSARWQLTRLTNT